MKKKKCGHKKRRMSIMKMVNRAQDEIFRHYKPTIPQCCICHKPHSVIAVRKPMQARPVSSWVGPMSAEDEVEMVYICRTCVAWIHNSAIEWLLRMGNI